MNIGGPGGAGNGNPPEIGVTGEQSTAAKVLNSIKPLYKPLTFAASTLWNHLRDAPANVISWTKVGVEKAGMQKVLREKQYRKLRAEHGAVYAKPKVTTTPQSGRSGDFIGRRVLLSRLSPNSNASRNFRAHEGIAMNERGEAEYFRSDDGTPLDEIRDRAGRTLLPVLMVDGKGKIFCVLKEYRLRNVLPSDGNWQFKEIAHQWQAVATARRIRNRLARFWGIANTNPMEIGKIDLPQRKGYGTGSDQLGRAALGLGHISNAGLFGGIAAEAIPQIPLNPHLGLAAGSLKATFPKGVEATIADMAKGMPITASRKDVQRQQFGLRAAGAVAETAFVAGFAAWILINIPLFGVPAAVSTAIFGGASGTHGGEHRFAYYRRQWSELISYLTGVEKAKAENLGKFMTDEKMQNIVRQLNEVTEIPKATKRALRRVLEAPKGQAANRLLATAWAHFKGLAEIMENPAYKAEFDLLEANRGVRDSTLKHPISKQWRRAVERTVVQLNEQPGMQVEEKEKLLLGLMMMHPMFAGIITAVNKEIGGGMSAVRNAYFTADGVPLFSDVRAMIRRPRTGALGTDIGKKGSKEAYQTLCKHLKACGLVSGQWPTHLPNAGNDAVRLCQEIDKMDMGGGFSIAQVRVIAERLDHWARKWGAPIYRSPFPDNPEPLVPGKLRKSEAVVLGLQKSDENPVDTLGEYFFVDEEAENACNEFGGLGIEDLGMEDIVHRYLFTELPESGLEDFGVGTDEEEGEQITFENQLWEHMTNSSSSERGSACSTPRGSMEITHQESTAGSPDKGKGKVV